MPIDYGGPVNGAAIGAFYADPGSRWDGRMDDFGIWNTALSEAEIADIMTNGIPEPTTMALLSLGVLTLVRRKRA
jgi:hypothetical protein